jgi:hypothetical protein
MRIVSVEANAKRDLPLTLCHRPAPEGAYDRLGLPTAPQRLVDTRAAILSEAVWVARNDPDRWISYSRHKAFYSHRSRYRPDWSYARILSAIDQLSALGWLDHEKSASGQRHRQSRFRASLMLMRAMQADPPRICDYRPELIVLRDSDGSLLEYEDTAAILRMREALQEINAAIAAASVALQGEVVRAGSSLRLPDRSYGARTQLYRVFNRTFDEGGRLYGGRWQNIPRGLRSEITINDCPVVELDYAAIHPRLLYDEVGGVLEGDPYEVPGIERSLAKLAFNALLNAKSRMSAIRAIAHQRGGNGAYAQARTLIAEIEVRHPAIAATFGTSAGRRLQRQDSDIAEAVLLRLIRQHRTIALPIHDSFLVPACRELALMEAMYHAAQEAGIVPSYEKVPQYGNEPASGSSGRLSDGPGPARISLVKRVLGPSVFVLDVCSLPSLRAVNDNDPDAGAA